MVGSPLFPGCPQTWGAAQVLQLMSMKRRQSQNHDGALIKRFRSGCAADDGSSLGSRFSHLLSQYPIVEALVAHLFPEDLDALAAASTAIAQVIFPQPESRLNLLSKMRCSGKGIHIRNQHHEKSAFFFHPLFHTEYATCGMYGSRIVESKPCVSCGHVTCDECRIHCVYQSIHEPAEEEDMLPEYSGFVLLGHEQFRILGPAHLQLAEEPAWEDNLTSNHDQGFLDDTIDHPQLRDTESVALLLDTNLGISDTPPLYGHLWDVSSLRNKRLYCNICVQRHLDEGPEKMKRCECTLRKRFVDRWLCLPCYIQEDTFDRQYEGDWPRYQVSHCPCGKELTNDNTFLLCLWCKGKCDKSGMRRKHRLD